MTHRITCCAVNAALLTVCFVWNANGAVVTDADAPETPAVETPLTETAPTYLLVAGDKLKIDVYNSELRVEYAVEIMIAPSGYVVMPSIGAIRCAGKSPETLSAELSSAYRAKAALKDAQAIVNVTGFAPRSIYVFGSVKIPREINMPVVRPLTVSQAISAAGGFLPDASLADIRILRSDIITGERQVIAVDMRAVMSDANLTEDALTQTGDTIYVPNAESVFILGAVNEPGEIQLPLANELRASQAIAISGGFRADAKRGAVQVRRKNKATGQLETLTINLGGAFDAGNDLVLLPGDTVYVAETDIVTVLGEVKTPGPVNVIDAGDIMSIRTMIAMAGGATPSANLDDVRLLRVLDDKSVKSWTVPVGNLTGDVRKTTLMHGDVIVVPRRDGVFVLGEVIRPGIYNIAPEQKLTVSQVLAAAGGFTNYAEKKRVSIFRRDANGKSVQIELNLVEITEKGRLEKDVELQPGDQVYFP